MEKQKFCQSCSMPMKKPEEFGTEANRKASQEYCCYCYQKGKFTENITQEQMVEKCAGIMKQMKMSASLIQEMKKMIPTLKRWNKK